MLAEEYAAFEALMRPRVGRLGGTDARRGISGLGALMLAENKPFLGALMLAEE